ncbi:MAG TPA: hypothetical protein VKB88_30410 [Bryobacteraceae bacterium]|nr:hypothetical protein [Bryobacteraceae bacterium]
MTLSYLWRLLCLSAAVFFLLNFALGAIVSLAAPLVIRLAERTAPRNAARLLLMARLAPAAVAALVVLAACVPSYLWLEPAASAEHVGTTCLAAAALGFLLCLAACARVGRAAARSHNFLRLQSPCLAMSGILRPRLIVAPVVRRALTPEQLEAALDHERAHWVSRDNLKRLLMLISPGILPFYCGLARLERAWNRLTEWAADDAAVAGSTTRSLSLAAALVSVARLQAAPPPPLATSLLGDSPDLAGRVARLLHRPPRREIYRRSGRPFVIASVALTVVLLNPSTLYFAHRLLERLME